MLHPNKKRFRKAFSLLHILYFGLNQKQELTYNDRYKGKSQSTAKNQSKKFTQFCQKKILFFKFLGICILLRPSKKHESISKVLSFSHFALNRCTLMDIYQLF